MPDPLAIELDSAVLPPIVLTPLSATAGGNATAGKLLALVKPAVTVRLNGTQVYHVAPAGEPGQTAALAVLFLLAILVLAAVGAWSLLGKR